MQSVSAARRLGGRLLSTREGTIALGVGAAALAGLLIFAYIKQYRASITEGAAPVSVLVAASLIEAGTPGDAVGQRTQFEITRIPRDDLKPGAISDPAALQGRYATTDIFPGQQLTLDAFGGLTAGALGTTLVDRERAIAVPIEGARGLAGTVQPGDRVDVLLATDVGGTSAVRTLMQDVPVISPPGGSSDSVGGGGGASAAVLRVDSEQAARLAFAAEHGKLWLVLRPRAGASPTRRTVVTTTTITSGG